MARAKKRFVVMLKNDLGDWRKIDIYTKLDKAQHSVEMSKLHDRNEIMYGYKDLHNEYRIDQIIVY